MVVSDERIIAQLAALAQSTRLAVFKALVRCGPGGMPAGNIATTVDVAPNTLSSHLGILQRSGLVTQRRSGRQVIYAANMAAVGTMIEALITEYCDSHPEVWSVVEPRTRQAV